MPSENRASFTAVVNSRTFTGYDDITNSYQGIWNDNVQGTSWFTTFYNWLTANSQAFEACQRNENPITLVVV